MEKCLPFTDDVMVVLVHTCGQHLLTLYLETLGYIPRLLNALNAKWFSILPEVTQEEIT